MRRKPGTLLPIEVDILSTGLDLRRRGETEFHGFGIANEMRSRDGAKRLTSHGTLYKALGRLEDGGLLESHWEDPSIAIEEGRPARRLYRVTGAGELALTRAEATSPSRTGRRHAGLEPS